MLHAAGPSCACASSATVGRPAAKMTHCTTSAVASLLAIYVTGAGGVDEASSSEGSSAPVPIPRQQHARRVSGDSPGGLAEEAFSFGPGLASMPDELADPSRPPAVSPEVQCLPACLLACFACSSWTACLPCRWLEMLVLRGQQSRMVRVLWRASAADLYHAECHRSPLLACTGALS